MNQLYAMVLWTLMSSISICSQSLAYTTHIQTVETGDQTQTVSFTFKLNKDEIIYKDSLQVTSNNPNVTLSAPTTTQEVTSIFDPSFNETKEGYANEVTFNVVAHNKDAQKSQEATIQAHYLVSNSKKPQTATSVINFTVKNEDANKTETTTAPQATSSDVHSNVVHESPANGIMQKISKAISNTTQKWYLALTSLFEDTGSYWLKYILALLLGLLLSLTPCIYPMIPVTVGVLQANKSSSSIKNFILALAYTVGISITFATIGFITALGSSVFGQLQSSPWVILPVIIVLIYLGLSMFGLYEMYIPRFMQPKNTTVKGGSLSSAFIFGAISGTVASPCLSPGLALIISYVHKITQTGSALGYLHGFLLLFAFGIGTSLPLLIIGTFSSSLNVLPRAGMWMVEIKRILGLMLIAMAFYYMQNILPWSILIWIITAFLFIIGMYYFADIKGYDSVWTRRYKYFIGGLFIIASCYTSFLGIKSMYNTKSSTTHEQSSLWLHDYEAARTQALAQNKRLILDFGTDWCAACKKLDKDVLSKSDVQKALQEYIPVKVNATDASSEPYAHLQQPLGIKGFPTIVVLDPKDESNIKQWIGYVTDVPQFITELTEHIK